MAKPFDVTVVIPVYNGEDFIADAVRSALGQTLPPREVIVVDDGSTDSTREVLAQFRDQIAVVRQRNMRLPAARNAGIRKAQAEWIAFLDADDVWKPNKLETVSQAVAAQEDVGLVFSAVEHWWPSTDRKRCRRRDSDVDCHQVYRELARRNVVLGGGSGPVVSRRCLLDVGLFDEGLVGGAEDWDMWIRIARRWRVVYCDDVLLTYREHGASMSKRSDLMLDYGLMVLRKHSAHFLADGISQRILRGTASRLYADAGIACFCSGELSKARSWLTKALKLDPFSAKAWVPMIKLALGIKHKAKHV